MIPVVKDNIKLKIALAIPARAPIILVKEIIDIALLEGNKTIKFFYKQSKAAMHLVSFYSLFFFLEFLH